MQYTSIYQLEHFMFIKTMFKYLMLIKRAGCYRSGLYKQSMLFDASFFVASIKMTSYGFKYKYK